MLMFCGSRSAAGSPVPPPFLFSPFLVGWGCAGGGGPSCAARRSRAFVIGRVRVVACLVCRDCVCLIVVCVFVVMSVRWMPWHWGPMKDVVACDIPRGAGLRAVIRGFPNGGTRRPLWGVTRV